jgi:coenzyme F420 hydrogenase subunit delta
MIGQMFEKRVLILGCGSILWGDDGFGPAVVSRLKEKYPLPEDVLALDAGTSVRDLLFDLALSETKPQKLIIVDTVEYPDHTPGEVFEIPVEGIPDKKTSDFSLHQFPTVNILQELKDHTGIQVKVIVGQIKEIPQEVHAGLTEVMEQAVDTACRRLLAEINES